MVDFPAVHFVLTSVGRWVVFGWAVVLLGGVAHADRVDDLSKAFSDPSYRVRVQAAYRLRQSYPYEKAVAALSRALKDDHEAVRLTATESLEAFIDREDARAALATAKNDANAAVRAQAAASLGKWRPPEPPLPVLSLSLSFAPAPAGVSEALMTAVTLSTTTLLKRTPRVQISAGPSDAAAIAIEATVHPIKRTAERKQTRFSTEISYVVRKLPGKESLFETKHEGRSWLATPKASEDEAKKNALLQATDAGVEALKRFLHTQRSQATHGKDSDVGH